MTMAGTRNIEDSQFKLTTDEDLANWRRTRGSRVLEANGVYWVEIAKGFYQGLHWLARVPGERAARPTPFCWGFQTTLDNNSMSDANASMPLHLLTDVARYDMSIMKPRQRNKLRNCLKQLDIVELCEPELLYEQGYPVYLSARQRTGYGEVLSEAGYRQELEKFFSSDVGMVIAGLTEGKLAGYITAYSVESAAYIEDVFVHTDHLKTNVSLGLFYEVARVCGRSGQVQELVHGLHTPEKESLCRHKEGLGFKVRHIPCHAWFLPVAGSLLRRIRPFVYYRLTGRGHSNDDTFQERGWVDHGPWESRQ